MKKPRYTKEQMLQWSRNRYDRIRLREGEDDMKRSGSMLREIEVMSRKEVAAVLGISKQAVHQLERSAILKIRRALKPLLEEINNR